MGAILSALILMGATLVAGVSSGVTATSARDKNWSRAKLMSAITASVSVVIVLICLYLLITYGSAAEKGLVGMKIAFIILLVTMMIVAAMEFIVLYRASKRDPSAFGMSVGASVISFAAFIISLGIIVFLA